MSTQAVIVAERNAQVDLVILSRRLAAIKQSGIVPPGYNLVSPWSRRRMWGHDKSGVSQPCVVLVKESQP
jgi:hypothetical protein